jgi:hypothetical protein
MAMDKHPDSGYNLTKLSLPFQFLSPKVQFPIQISKFYQAISNQNRLFRGFDPKSTKKHPGCEFSSFRSTKISVLKKNYEICTKDSVE